MKKQQKIILLIEDEASLRGVLKEKLIQEGYEVLEANNGNDAKELVFKEDFDLVLLDLMLPDIPGEQVLKEMHDKKLTNKIPVIVLSAKGNAATINNCIEVLGAYDYLIKSDNTLEEIANKIKKALKK